MEQTSYDVIVAAADAVSASRGRRESLDAYIRRLENEEVAKSFKG